MTNEERYKTPEERTKSFRKFCNSKQCDECECAKDGRRRVALCEFHWLALEAEEEKPLPCPFCGCDAEVVRPKPTDGVLVRCNGCYSKSMIFGVREEAIAAWNRRTK